MNTHELEWFPQMKYKQTRFWNVPRTFCHNELRAVPKLLLQLKAASFMEDYHPDISMYLLAINCMMCVRRCKQDGVPPDAGPGYAVALQRGATSRDFDIFTEGSQSSAVA